MTTLSIPITGMHCGGCVAGVKAALSKVAGVADADVRIGEATITFDPALTGPDALRGAIAAAGYEPAAA